LDDDGGGGGGTTFGRRSTDKAFGRPAVGAAAQTSTVP